MSADHTRDPCPIVILNDFGGAFAMGVIGGCVWHGIKVSEIHLMVKEDMVPFQQLKLELQLLEVILVFGVVYFLLLIVLLKPLEKRRCLECSYSWVFTGGALAIRGGWKHTRNSAITCACLLGVFEGVGMMMQRLQAQPTMAPVYPEEAPKLAA